MFKNIVALLHDDVSMHTRTALRKGGAAVVDEITDAVNICIVPGLAIGGRKRSGANDEDDDDPVVLSGLQNLKARRVPIVREEWVEKSISSGGLIAAQHPVALWDPHCFRSLEFTTSDLPSVVRENIKHAVRFYGGTYSRDLKATTSIVITNSTTSQKVLEARRRGILCEPVGWFQDCVTLGRRIRPSNPFVKEIAFDMVCDVLMLSGRTPSSDGGSASAKKEGDPLNCSSVRLAKKNDPDLGVEPRSLAMDMDDAVATTTTTTQPEMKVAANSLSSDKKGATNKGEAKRKNQDREPAGNGLPKKKSRR